ncbi:MAG: hypothetical protein FWF09_03230 [Bacteroidales bacterium]|nr:hypothetical protein [Bacteroidales bacterium]
MKKIIEKLGLLLLVGCLVCVISCSKDSNSDPEPPKPPVVTPEKAIEALREFAETSGQFDATVKESGNIVDDTGLEPTRNLYGTNGYPVIACEAQGDKWLVTCDYGPTFIPCSDGYLRKGVVNILTTGFFTMPGTVMVVTFDNYYQKGEWLTHEYKIEGTQEIINAGANSANPLMTDYNVTVTDGIITYNAKKVHYSETTIRTLLPDTAELCENKWYITGEWNGKSSSDISYTLTANTTPLYYRVCCHFFQDGILTVDIEGLSKFTIDYGYYDEEKEPEECDREALLTYPGLGSIVIPM